MGFQEFIGLITEARPRIEEYPRVVPFVESASIEDLQAALGTANVHWLYRALIQEVLAAKIRNERVAAELDSIIRGYRERAEREFESGPERSPGPAL